MENIVEIREVLAAATYYSYITQHDNTPHF